MGSALLPCLLVLCLAAAPSARAGDVEQIVLPGTEGRPPLEGSVAWGAPPGPVDGWGWVRVDLHNAEAVPRTALVEVATNDRQFQVQRALVLPAGGRASAWIPRIGLPPGGTFSISAAGHESVGGGNWHGSYGQVIVAAIGTEKATERLLKAIGKVMTAGVTKTAPRGRVRDALSSMDLAADQVPDAWTYLTSLWLLHVDGSAPGLDDAALQRVIVQYVGAGGSLLVTREASLPSGPLRELVSRATADPGGLELRTVRHGLGACWIVGKSVLGTVEFEGPSFEKFVGAWQERTEGRATGWPTWPDTGISIGPRGFFAELRIPGLGELPVRLFFLLILAFAIVVGPVAYLTLRRRKKLTKMLWFVPAIGLGFAGAILLYGLFSEGLGTKGAVRSLTVLDQRTHEAFGAHSRTLYAGVSPSGLRVSADTALFLSPLSASSMRRSIRSERIGVEPAEGRWTGDVLPSRTPTVFRTITQGRARERLRFRRGPDGTYELLAGEGFQPIDAPSALLFHALDGSWHSLRRRGRRLTPVKLAEVDDLIAGISKAVTGAETVSYREMDDYPFGAPTFSYNATRKTEPRVTRTEGWTRALVGDLPRGAYLGWMTSAPVFDDLGLDVEWLETRHLVMGLLAPEDVDG